MELLTPDTGLLIWTLLPLTSLALFVLALIGLLRKTSWPDTTTKIWALVIIFVPSIGPILYLIIERRQKMASVE